MSLQAGQILADKYRIVKLLGKGGMGEVYEGENVRIRRRVAIKTLLAHVSEKPDVLQRFEREAQAAGRIGSEHIVEVLDLGDLPDKSRFMVMEFCEGSTLSDRIISRGRIPPIEAARIVGELLEGLGAAHAAGIIHRDLKPANVFLLASKPNRPDFVKILDFGVSKFSVLGDEMSMTRTGAVVGTPYYMSPEQAKGAKFIDARSDLYSVGVILYETITGQVPFNAETFNELIFKIALESPPPPETFVPTLDPAFAAIIRKAMAREADDRFQTPAEFKAALDHWAHGAAMGAQPVPNAIPAYAPAPAHAAQPQQHYGAYAPANRAHSPAAPTVAGAPPAPSPKLGGGTAMMDGRPGPGATVIAQAYATPPPPMAGAIPALPAVPNVLTAPVARPAQRKRSPLPIVAVIGVLLLGGAAAAFLILARKPSDAQADTATATATTTAPATTTTAAAPKATTTTPAPSATTPLSVEPVASAAPSAEPSAEPTATSPIAMNPGTGGGFIPRPPPTNPTANPPPTTPTTATTPTGKPTGRTIDGSL